MTEFSHNALTALVKMIELSQATETLTNEELAHILIEQVWCELDLDTAAAALISEVARRLAPNIFEEEPPHVE